MVSARARHSSERTAKVLDFATGESTQYGVARRSLGLAVGGTGVAAKIGAGLAGSLPGPLAKRMLTLPGTAAPKPVTAGALPIARELKAVAGLAGTGAAGAADLAIAGAGALAVVANVGLGAGFVTTGLAGTEAGLTEIAGLVGVIDRLAGTGLRAGVVGVSGSDWMTGAGIGACTGLGIMSVATFADGGVTDAVTGVPAIGTDAGVAKSVGVMVDDVDVDVDVGTGIGVTGAGEVTVVVCDVGAGAAFRLAITTASDGMAASGSVVGASGIAAPAGGRDLL